MSENMSGNMSGNPVAFQTIESTSIMAQNFQNSIQNNFIVQNEPQSKKPKLHQEETDFYIPNQDDSSSIPPSSSGSTSIIPDGSSSKRKQPKPNSSNVPKPIHKCAFCDFVTVTQKSFEEHHRENHKNEDVNKQTKILSQVSKFPPA